MCTMINLKGQRMTKGIKISCYRRLFILSFFPLMFAFLVQYLIVSPFQASKALSDMHPFTLINFNMSKLQVRGKAGERERDVV